MVEFLLFLHQYIDSIAVLALSAIGLAVIFGTMGVINMAHGELMMIGAYATAYSVAAGVPLPFAILSGGIAAGLGGVLIERLVVCHFYGRILASLVATWGLSIAMSQATLILLGPTAPNPAMSFGTVRYGGFGFSLYPLVFFGVAAAMILALYLLLRRTSYGAAARATMENPIMARAIGIPVRLIYVATFALGAFMAGVAGGLFSLTAPVEPTFGNAFTPLAFVVVVVAGQARLISGLILTVAVLALVRTAMTNEFNILIGHLGMLAAAFLVIRFAPDGLSSIRVQRWVRLPVKSKL